MQFQNCITFALPLTHPKNGVNTTFFLYGNASNASNAEKEVSMGKKFINTCESLCVFFFRKEL